MSKFKPGAVEKNSSNVTPFRCRCKPCNVPNIELYRDIVVVFATLFLQRALLAANESLYCQSFCSIPWLRGALWWPVVSALSLQYT